MNITITATFTAEPIKDSINFLTKQLNYDINLKFSPYNQVFQQLLDPNSNLRLNAKNNFNVLLINLEDWIPIKKTLFIKHRSSIANVNIDEFIHAIQNAQLSNCFVLICPPQQLSSQYKTLETKLINKLHPLDNVYAIGSDKILELYNVTNYFDKYKNKIAHIPYTDKMFTALGLMVMRQHYSFYHKPYKVIALDCDNTLWQGVCAEVGPCNVKITKDFAFLQNFMLQMAKRGFLLCLVSKNNPNDVEAVFANNKNMRLNNSHLSAKKINWQTKSANLMELAKEFNLGLDGFIFIDDNPIECAEINAALPEVLTLQLPKNPANFKLFLNNIWAFDKLKITKEDASRTRFYQDNVKREQLKKSINLKDFIANLNLKITIAPLCANDLARASQLTMRTNQFNFNPNRYEIKTLKEMLDTEHQALSIRVEDKFGYYGFVGLVIYKFAADTLITDSFLLSCRALGRGIEHKMLAKLGQIAKEHNLAKIMLRFKKTPKNIPAHNFIQSIKARKTTTGYEINTNDASKIEFKPEEFKQTDKATIKSATINKTSCNFDFLINLTIDELSNKIHGNNTPTDNTCIRSHIRSIIKNILINIEGTNATFTDDESLVIKGRIDSLHIVDLACQLEKTYHINFAAKGFNQYDFDTVDQIVELVASA